MAKAPAKKQAPAPVSQSANKPSAKSGDPSPVHEFFVAGIQDIYWAENHLIKAIPKMIAAAGAAHLKKALSNHLSVTQTHASRLEKAFDLLGQKIIARKCDAMEGLTMSGEHAIENTVAGTPVRDLGIIMSAIKVENFEATCYKGLIQLATALGKEEVAALLKQTMDEELTASDMLIDMSQSYAPTVKS